MSFLKLLKALEQHYLDYSTSDSGDYVSMIESLHEVLWGHGDDYRSEEIEFSDGSEAFFEVESISSKEFVEHVELYIELSDSDKQRLIKTLEEWIGDTLYFVREWYGNDNFVEVFNVSPTIYNDFDMAKSDCDTWIKDYKEKAVQEHAMAYNMTLLKMFMEINPTVEVLDVEPETDKSVPSIDGNYLRVTTKDHGWLHVYVNQDTQQIEWY